MPKTDWEQRVKWEAERYFGLRPNQVSSQSGPTILMDGVLEFALHCLREFQAEAVGIAKQEALDESRHGNQRCVHTANFIVVGIESMLPPAKKEG